MMLTGRESPVSRFHGGIVNHLLRLMGERRRPGRTARRVVAAAILALLGVGLSAAPSFADSQGQSPDIWTCGAFRDVPSQWTAVPNVGWCTSQPGEGVWGYSWVWTSPTTVHYATWDFSPGFAANEPLHLEAFIPANTGAVAQYDYQVCGSSSWTSIGTINQFNASGWWTTGQPIPAGTWICKVREHNTGPGSWNLGEDALGFHP